MASKNCQWLWTILKCCGLEKKGQSLEEIEEETTSEEEVIGDSTSVKFFFDEIALNGPAEAFHSPYAVLSTSCPAVINSSPTFWKSKDDHRGYKCPSIKTRNHPEPPAHHQKLSSDSQINFPSKTPLAAGNNGPPKTLNSLVGDGNYATQLQNQGDVEVGVKPSGSDQLPDKGPDEGENHLNAGESVPPPPKDSKPSADPKNEGPDDLARFTSPANLPRRRNNPTIIVYHVAVADRSRNLCPNGFRPEENDVEMEDLSNQNEDVEMADLTMDGNAASLAAAPCALGTQNVEVVATIEQGISSTSVALKSADFSSSINVVASMRYVSGPGGGGGSGMMSCSETSMSTPRVKGDGSPSENSQETIVVIGDPGCKRTILWNEAVKVIYFDGSSKLRNSTGSGEGKQDLVAWEIVPLKNAPKGSRSKWVKAVKSGFIRSDLYSLQSDGGRPYHSEYDLRRDGTEEDDSDESYSSFSSSSSRSSSGDN